MSKTHERALQLKPVAQDAHTDDDNASDTHPLLPPNSDLEAAGQGSNDIYQKPTPLPVIQVAIVIFLRTVVPINLQIIFPFINQHVNDLPNSPAHDQPARVGYYVGIIEGIFLACMCVISLPFGRYADKLGRKTMLLVGLGGATLSTLAFGFASSLQMMIFCRAISGLTNGSVGVLRTVMAEITDASNRSRAFTLFPLAFASGTSIGALIGGQAYQSFETTRYPAALPCGIAGIISATGLLVTLLFFKETLPPEKRRKSENETGTPSVRELLTPTLTLLLFNYAFLSFSNAAQIAIFPLFAFTPVHLGGLGWNQQRIGTVMALQAIPTVLVQLALFPKYQKRFGNARLYQLMMPTFLAAILLLPALPIAKAHLPGKAGDFALWLGIVVFTLLYSFGGGSGLLNSQYRSNSHALRQ